MTFTVLIPARLASTRLPNKPLADIAGVPMVVRVAQQAQLCLPLRVVVAADDASIVTACSAHGVTAVLTRTDHLSGSDRLAQASHLLGLSPDDIVVNVQGDEPLIAPNLITAVAELLQTQPLISMSTAAHPIVDKAEFLNPNVVKVVLNVQGHAMYFSRAPIAFARDGQDGWATITALQPAARPLRHVGIYGYRVGFLRTFPTLTAPALETTECLEQLRALWHGHRIAVHVTNDIPLAGVDTPEDLARARAVFTNRTIET